MKHRAIRDLISEEKLFWRNTRESRVPYNRRESVIPKCVLLGLENTSSKVKENTFSRQRKHNRRSNTIDKNVLLNMIRDSNNSNEPSKNSSTIAKIEAVQNVQTVQVEIPRKHRRRASSTMSAACRRSHEHRKTERIHLARDSGFYKTFLRDCRD